MRRFFESLSGQMRGTTLQGAFLVLTLGLALWLGYQAVDAASSHRRTAEAALADYAGISAWEFSRAARSSLDEMLRDVFRPVRRRMRGDLPSPGMVGRDLYEAATDDGCRCLGFNEPLALFRVETDPRRVEVVPDTLSPETRDRLMNLVLSQRLGRRIDAVVTSPAGEVFQSDVAVGFMVSRDEREVVEAVFGFVVRADALGEFLAEIYDEHDLLPEPIARGQPNDSLLHVRVRDGSGLVIFASPTAGPEEWTSIEPMGQDFGTLAVEATVRPEAAESLVIGGLPQSRLPMLAVLLALTLGVGVAAFVQLRRERQFQRLRDDFVSGVSHELRTPLTQIQMFAELQDAGKLTSEEDRRRAVAVIHRESRRLSHLVENILQFSRIRRRPRLISPMESLDLAQGLAEGIDAVTPLLHDREVTLDLEAEDGLLVLANRDALTRVMVNLLDNAVKYGPQGQRVSVRIGRNNGSARFSVADQGPGIPASGRRDVFKSYRRLSRDLESTVPGTGIGLSVVERLVSMHQGRVWVEDSEGGGTRFVVELPLAGDHVLEDA